MVKTLILAFLFFFFVVSAQKLSSYNVDKDSVTISGLSSGGYFAVQFQIAYSSLVKGAAPVAGGPYGCAQFQLMRALGECMVRPTGINVQNLVSFAKSSESRNEIDSLSNILKQKIFVFHGTRDTTVNIGTSKKLVEFYQSLGHKDIKTNFELGAEHAMITNKYGNSCTSKGSPYINNCNYDLAGEILKYFYGSLKDPKPQVAENLMKYDQNEFTSSLGSKGMVYVPTKCKDDKKCKLHVVFHGCLQYYDKIGDIYAKHTGYNEWAEANNIIILYPQTKSSSFMPMNPNGCWDWWGYGGRQAYYKKGPQMEAVKKMIDRVTK
eukprot:gene6029-10031_t